MPKTSIQLSRPGWTFETDAWP